MTSSTPQPRGSGTIRLEITHLPSVRTRPERRLAGAPVTYRPADRSSSGEAGLTGSWLWHAFVTSLGLTLHRRLRSRWRLIGPRSRTRSQSYSM